MLHTIKKTTMLVATLILSAFVHQANATVVSVDESITITDPPTDIIASNNPFTFFFTSLPTTPLTNATLSLTGIADIDGWDVGVAVDESFTVSVDGMNYGTVDPNNVEGNYNFSESITILLADLQPKLVDGELSVVVNFSNEVNAPASGDYITANLTYRASVPEPTTLALMGLGLAGIGYQRRRSKKVV